MADRPVAAPRFAAICGLVNGEPGVYEIGPNAVVRDLIAAAGGATDAAMSRFVLYTNGTMYDGDNFDIPVQDGDVVVLQRFGGPRKATRTLVLVSPAGRPIVAEVAANEASLKQVAEKLPVDVAHSARLIWPGNSSPLRNGSIIQVAAVNGPYWKELAARLPVIRPAADVAANAPAEVVAPRLEIAEVNSVPALLAPAPPHIAMSPQTTTGLVAPRLPVEVMTEASVPNPVSDPQLAVPVLPGTPGPGPSVLGPIAITVEQQPPMAPPNTLRQPASESRLVETQTAMSPYAEVPLISGPAGEGNRSTMTATEPTVEATVLPGARPPTTELPAMHAIELTEPIKQLAEVPNEVTLMSQTVISTEPTTSVDPAQPDPSVIVETPDQSQSTGFLIGSAVLSLVIAGVYMVMHRGDPVANQVGPEDLAASSDGPTSMSDMPVIKEATTPSEPLSIAGRVVALGHLRIDAAHDQPSGPHFGPASRRSQRRSEVDVSRLKGDVLGRALAIMDQERG